MKYADFCHLTPTPRGINMQTHFLKIKQTDNIGNVNISVQYMLLCTSLTSKGVSGMPILLNMRHLLIGKLVFGSIFHILHFSS